MNKDINSKINWAKLGSLAHVVRGSSPRPKGSPFYYGGNIPRLMVADVTRDGMYVTPSIDTLTEEGAKKSRPMKKGDVIIQVSGNPGTPCILNTDCCIHDGFAGLRDLNMQLIHPPFLYYYLSHVQDVNSKLASGGIWENLETKHIRGFDIPLLKVEEQKAITNDIEIQFAHIESMRQAALKQKEAAEALQSAILREKFSWRAGESLPAGWRWEKIDNCITDDIDKFRKSSHPSKEISYIDISSVDSFSKSVIEPKVIERENAPSRAKYILRENDIVISNVRPNLNAVALIDKQHENSIGTSGFTVVRLKEGYEPNYFFHFFTSPYFVDYVTELVQGAMYPAINDKDIKKCLIPVPNFETQKSIAELITRKIKKVISINQPLDTEIAAIEALPAAILREVFNFEKTEK